MSGGHWNYRQYSIRDNLTDVGRDGDVILRFPKLAHIIRNLGEVLEKIIHELDYDLSGDSSIDDDLKFEEYSINMIAEILEKKYKIKVYEIEEE